MAHKYNMHFAYPNVIPRAGEFIGCGRYTTFQNDRRVPEEYTLQENTPNTPNRLGVEHAMQVLAPNAFNKANCIYEIKDNPTQRYQGNSLDLAYLLAHVSRELESRYLLGDVWCTGSVHVNEGLPVLKKVDDTGFLLKLQAFLAPENKDSLFIVPAANITNTINENITENKVQAYSLSQSIKSQLKRVGGGGKTIIKVLPHELPLLVETLVVPQQKKRSYKKIALAGVVLFTLVSTFCSLYFYAPLSKTNHAQVVVPSKEKTSSIDRQGESLIASVSSPVNVDLGFTYRKGGTEQQTRLDVTSKSLTELILSHRDFYRLSISPKNKQAGIY